MAISDAIIRGTIRFEAEWITKKSPGDIDRDEFGHSYHSTREAAEQAAITASKQAAQCEWILVAEQQFVGLHWVDTIRWTGDWDGLHDEDTIRERV